MEVRDLGLGVKEITPRRFSDARGFFAETWQRGRFADAGIDVDWVQENQSLSADTHVLRGLHLQVSPTPQAKLIRVLRGRIYDVAVDVRPGSPSLGKWISCVLSAEAFNQLYIPAGFAHGFLTLEPGVEVMYKVSAPYAPNCERGIIWSDTDIAIDWPLSPGELPLLSEKDGTAMSLAAFVASGEI
ncbi:MAG: dTDP-4-dehydrorhamnose 3,5-epimerase [Alphaproteobacteria bacterium]|nr:dTDP-4-dehydrorhamnose 3,5-epimerase [Alphaproteobacteria bacterium]